MLNFYIDLGYYLMAGNANYQTQVENLLHKCFPAPAEYPFPC